MNQDGVLSMKFHAKGLIEGDVIVGLPGRFNIYNGMCAATVGALLGMPQEVILHALEHVQVRGRVENVPTGRGFSILIDFAHNGVSTESVLKTLRGYNPNRIIAIFGCGGNRSKLRRYEMGEAVGNLAEWGYQLARLYEQEGRRQECIAECQDLILWFGEGRIVDKARELLNRCLQPDWQPPKDEEIPEPEEPEKVDMIPYASEPVRVREVNWDEDEEEDIDEEEEFEELEDGEEEPEAPDNTEDAKREPAESTEDIHNAEVSEIPEPADHLEDIEEGIIEKTEKFGKEPEPARELIEEPGPEETVPEEAEEKPHKDKKPGALSRIRNFFHMSLELDPEFFEEEEEEAEREEEQADEQQEEPETAEKPQQEEKLKPVAQLEVKEERQEQLEVEAVSQPVQLEVQEEKKAASVETIVEPVPAPIAEDLPEELEDISEHGISYRTLKGTMLRLGRCQDRAHFVFAGGEDRITLAVAKRVTKELNKIGYFSAGSINRIAASKLNALEITDQTDKLVGCCTLITNAPELSKKSVYDLIHCMKQYKEKIVIMLTGPFDEMDCFLSIYPELAELIDYKVRM